MIKTALAALALTACAGAALAQSQRAPPAPRCALLGQMAVSSWLDMLGAIGTNSGPAIDEAATRLDRLSGSYATLQCDMSRLAQALDCLLDQSGTAAPQDLARRCMAQSGLATQG
jgi:hypothetical protein